MPQQVNLCLPILRKQKSRFAAQTLAQALVIVCLVGGVLSAAWVWNLSRASDSLNATLAAQTKELDGLRVALEQSRASTGPAEAAMVQQVQQRKLELQQREIVLGVLSEGLFQPGRGHAARLQLVAHTIPAQAWVTQIRSDERLLEVSGYTLEPSALNDWVGKLAASALLKGQTLSTVKVESLKPESILMPAATATTSRTASQPAIALPPVWSFSLLSSAATPSAGIAVSAVPAASTGSRP